MADITAAVARAFASNYSGSGDWLNEATTGSVGDGTISGAEIRAHDGTAAGNFFRHPGIAGNFLRLFDSVPLSITGDIDIRWVGSLDDWTSGQVFYSKWPNASSNKSIFFFIDGSGNGAMLWSTNGTNQTQSTCDTAFGFSDGTKGSARLTVDVDNGSSNADIKWWKLTDPDTDPEDETNWEQVGSTNNPGAVMSFHDGTGFSEIGSHSSGASLPLKGDTHRLLLYDVIDGAATDRVLDINPALLDMSTVEQAGTFTEDSDVGGSVTVDKSSGTGYKIWLIDRQTFEFDGINDKISFADANDLDWDDGTVGVAALREDWTPGSAGYLMAKSVVAAPNLSNYVIYSFNSAQRTARFDGAEEGDNANPAITDGATATLVGVFDYSGDGDIQMYGDGVASGSPTADTTTPGQTQNAGALDIGGSTVWNQWHQGLLWSFAVIPSVLTDGEVGTGTNTLHDNLLNQTVPAADLVGFWGLRAASWIIAGASGLWLPRHVSDLADLV